MARLITETFEGDHFFRFGNQLGINGTPSIVLCASEVPVVALDGLRALSMGHFDAVLDMPLLNYSGNPTLGVAPGTTVTPNEIYFGFFFWANNPDEIGQPGVGGTDVRLTHRIVSVWNGTNGICTLRISAEGDVKLQLMDGAFFYTDAAFDHVGTVNPVPIANSTGSQPISAGTLYHIQMHVKLNGMNSVVEVKQDDTLVISYTGPLNGGLDTEMTRIIWYSAGTSYAQNYETQYFDDIVVNDTTSALCATDATWPGILRFKVQEVSGPGTYSQFTPVGFPQNYQNVQDIPNDGDNTYNYALQTHSGFKDSFPVDPNALNPLQITYRAWFEEVIARKTGGTAKLVLGVRRAGTDYLQPVGQDVGVSYDVYDDRLCTDPSSLIAWTSAGLDATEIIYEIV
jgi:hypothetical protein